MGRPSVAPLPPTRLAWSRVWVAAALAVFILTQPAASAVAPRQSSPPTGTCTIDNDALILLSSPGGVEQNGNMISRLAGAWPSGVSRSWNLPTQLTPLGKQVSNPNGIGSPRLTGLSVATMNTNPYTKPAVGLNYCRKLTYFQDPAVTSDTILSCACEAVVTAPNVWPRPYHFFFLARVRLGSGAIPATIHI